MKFGYILTVFFAFSINVLMGIFLINRPAGAIELQRKFYEKINWRLVPISMERELRNMRRAGAFLIVFSFVALIYILMEGIF